MATTVEDIKTTYPIPSFHYVVDIDGMDPIAFSEVSGLNIEVKPITYRDGLSVIQGSKHMPGLAEPAKITLKKGIVQKGSQLYDWLNSIRITTVEKKNITASLMDEKGEIPVVSWKIKNAFPLKIDASSMDATKNEVAVETLELMADEVKIEYN